MREGVLRRRLTTLLSCILAVLASITLESPQAEASIPLDAAGDFWAAPGNWTVSIEGAPAVTTFTSSTAIFGPYDQSFIEVGAGTFVFEFFGNDGFIGELVGGFSETKLMHPVLTADTESLRALITTFHDSYPALGGTIADSDVSVISSHVRFRVASATTRISTRLNVAVTYLFGPAGAQRTATLTYRGGFVDTLQPIPRGLRNVLCPSSISRDPRLYLYPGEEDQLYQSDANLLAAAQAAGINNAHDVYLNIALQRAGIYDPYLAAYAVSDFRNSSTLASLAAGGLTANRVVLVDGKLLDILRDVANYRALQRSGSTSISEADALDDIVREHTSFLGSASFGLAFPSVTLSETQLATADESFIELAGTMLYHEFGHHFLWHMLKGARQQALCYFQGICLPTGPNESRADAVAGELGRKAGYSVGLMRMTYDLLAYYAAIRSNSFLTWSTVQSSTFQFAVSDSRYPSIGTRKEILRSAWIRF